MNPSLAIAPAASHSPASGRHPAARPVVATAFVERRCLIDTEGPTAIRTPLVLGFAGVVSGLLISAGLIVAIAFVLALLEVRWSNASHYSLGVVLVVFGAAAAVLHWNIGDATTRLLASIEPTVERRAYYLHLSSLNAFENLRVVEHARLPAANATTLEPSLPATQVADATRTQRRPSQPVHRVPMHQRFYSQHEAKARAPMNNWAWDRAETA